MAGGYKAPKDGIAALIARLNDLERRLNALAAAAGLESAVIGKGGITVRGGRVIAEHGALFSRNMETMAAAGLGGGQIRIFPHWLPQGGGDRSAVIWIPEGEDAGNNLWIRPPQDPGTSGSPTYLSLRGPGGGLSGWVWVASDGGLSVTVNDILLLNTPNLHVTVPDSSGSANCFLNPVSGNPGRYRVFRSTSTRRNKRDVRDAPIDPADVLALRPVTFRDKHVEDDVVDKRHLGLIAEEVHDAGVTEIVGYDAEGLPESVAYDRLAVAQQVVIRDQQRRLSEQDQKIAALIDANAALAGRLDALEADRG